MNDMQPPRQIDGPPTQSAEDVWRARNERTLGLGLAWLRARLDALIVAQRAAPSAFDTPAGEGVATDSTMGDLRADWLLRKDEGVSIVETEALARMRAEYDAARREMAEAGEPFALDLLAAHFDLAPFDIDALLIIVAPQIDAALGALYGYAHDRLALTFATRHLVALLLGVRKGARAIMRARLAPDSPLRRNVLVSAAGPDALAPLALDERMIDFIHTRVGADPRVGALLRAPAPAPLAGGLIEKTRALVRALTTADVAVAQIVGPRGSGRRAVAQGVAAAFGLRPVEMALHDLPTAPEARRETLALIARETVLSQLCLVLDVDAQGDAGGLREFATSGATAALFVAEEPVAWLADAPSLKLPTLSREDRMCGWRAALADHEVEPNAFDSLVDQFAFGPSQIAEVAASLGADVGPGAATLWAACRARATARLDGLAQRIEPRRGWDDLVLPEAVMRDLRAVSEQARRRAIVYGRWGYDALLPRGRGVSALFAGPSGVGKTLAAEAIAHELDLDLYCVDLSTVVSKYIGETEKNLKRVFDAAEESGAVLFFDEADALFGKRSEVKDSHDRYANIEVGYLLQRIEQYAGLAILATNMKSHLDFGFLRRLRYLIDIPFPGFADRRALWRRAFPARAPLDDIDFERLAGLELAGGNIIVIAVNAAFLAAADGGGIAMRHVEQAARAEFRKLDRIYDMPAARGGGL